MPRYPFHESDSGSSSSSSSPSYSAPPSNINLESAAKRNGTSNEARTPASVKDTNTGLTGSKKRKRDEETTNVPEKNEDVNVIEEPEDEVKVLSHKEQRKLRKKQKLVVAGAESAPGETATDSNNLKPKSGKGKSKKRKGEENADDLPKRQNSVWVGNLSYKTTPEALRAFFTDAGAGEVTRVNMPTKGAPGVEKMKGVKTVKENRGFAYVDFSTPEGKALAISMSEKNLDGRRLLIKDGDDFTGRPTVASTESGLEGASQANATTSNSPERQTGFALGPTKTAKKILAAQKQPPCPCLFLGNLGFEATEEKIKQMFEGHTKAIALMKAKKKREKEKKSTKNVKGKRKDDDLMGIEHEEKDEEDEDIDVEVDVGIRKVRLGTFEDSGVCKGWAFVDFTTTQHATAALTNPANHFLDGRALVVEYASLDAARRGGYRPDAEKKEREMKMKEKESRRLGKDKYNDWKKKVKPGQQKNDGEVNASQLGANAEETQKGDDVSGEPNTKRPRTEAQGTDTARPNVTRPSKKEKRLRPGAALASAQREKYAIVPSEGTRLKFS